MFTPFFLNASVFHSGDFGQHVAFITAIADVVQWMIKNVK
jgi:hypothetical protein